ncbi:C2 domain-containing protein [Mortierella sp. GBAus27b]|nr:hypothetical protein BGX31_002467 [Mortierella sp. GBA43]KAI8353959.1 C2 domain-containing protein [Mortierella sp. GBAus27b]
MAYQGPTLVLVAHGARNLKDVEHFGKQDAYLQFSLNVSDSHSFQKTFVHKNSDDAPAWNQTFTLPLAGQPELFIEIMDSGITADAVIAFTAIPINHVVYAPGGTLSGWFAVNKPDESPGGEVHLTLTAHNVPGQNTDTSAPPAPCTSHIVEAHRKRVQSLKKRERVAGFGAAALGGIVATGVGLLANNWIGNMHKEDQAREDEAKKLEEEKRQLAQAQQDLEREKQQAQKDSERAQQQAHAQSSQPQYQPQSSSQGGSHEVKDKGKREKKKKRNKKDSGSSSSSSSSSSESDSD